MSNPVESFTVETETFSLGTPTKTGYTFNGWTGSNGTELSADVTIEKGSIGNLEYEAHWTANTYSISYNGNGNTSGSMSTSTHTYDVEKALTTNSYVRAGYSFNGWNSNADGTGTSYANKATVLNLASENGAVVTLYAQWKALSTTLITGEKFQDTIVSGVTKTVFTDTIAPSGVTVKDLSAAGDNGVVGWVQSGTYYISTQRSGVKIKANADSAYMFYANANSGGNALWQKVTSHNLTNLDTSAVTSMRSFFGYNYALTSIIGLNGLNTSSVNSMYCMFYHCHALPSVNVTGWNVAKVTTMQSMFAYCYKLTTVTGIQNWTTTSLKEIPYLFDECTSMVTLNLSGWNTSNVTVMRYAFAYMDKLKTLTLGSNWTTANVTDIAAMFTNSPLLTLNCKNWNVKKVTNHNQFNSGAPGVTAPTWP